MKEKKPRGGRGTTRNPKTGEWHVKGASVQDRGDATSREKASGVKKGLEGMGGADDLLKSKKKFVTPVRTKEEQVGAEEFADEFSVKESRERITQGKAYMRTLENSLAQEKRRPGYLLGLRRKEASLIQEKIEQAKHAIADEEKNLEYELEEGERAYKKAKEEKSSIDALVQEFEQQTVNGASPRGKLNMATIEERQGMRFVVAANGFPAHLSAEKIEKLYEEHGHMAPEYGVQNTWDLLYAMRNVRRKKA